MSTPVSCHFLRYPRGRGGGFLWDLPPLPTRGIVCPTAAMRQERLLASRPKADIPNVRYGSAKAEAGSPPES